MRPRAQCAGTVAALLVHDGASCWVTASGWSVSCDVLLLLLLPLSTICNSHRPAAAGLDSHFVQVLECAHKFKSQEKAAVLSAIKGDDKYKAWLCAEGCLGVSGACCKMQVWGGLLGGK